MKIVITDGFTLNPGDLDWAPVSALGDISYHDSTKPEEIMDRCGDADIIITNKTVIPAALIKTSQKLKMIAVSATGYNNVDVEAARSKNIIVCNVPEYGTYSVAQHTFALLLELVNHVGINSASVRNDDWAASGSWSYTKLPVTELKDKVLGIVGFGRIGQQVAILAHAFGMQVIFNNRSPKNFANARQVSLEDLLATSDVVSLHCPLTAENTRFIDLHHLRMMKKNAILLNTSRGALVNENDLLQALNENTIAGAGLDVLTIEPPAYGHPLIHHPLCVVTPHNAWLSFEARKRLLEVTAKNIRSFMDGQPVNIVGG